MIFTKGFFYPIINSQNKTELSKISFKFERLYFLVAIAFFYEKHIVLPLYGRLYLPLSRADLPEQSLKLSKVDANRRLQRKSRVKYVI